MPDIFFLLDMALKLFILSVFFILFITQLSQIRNEPIRFKYILIAMLCGVLGFSILLIDTIFWEVNPDKENRRIFHVIVFVFLQVYAYFWYLHYESIISVRMPKRRNLPLLALVILNVTISSLYFLGFNLGLFSELWDLLGISTHEGRIVTIVSHLAFFTWVPVCGIAIFIILGNGLVELRKISMIELAAIAIQFVASSFLLMDDIFITFSLYDRSTSELMVTIGLLVFFIGLLSLLLSYLVLNPSHVQSPSIQQEYYEQLRFAFSDPKLMAGTQSGAASTTAVTGLIPKKLPSTAIFILIHILNSEDSMSYAKSIETTLNLNKSTVSYNLSLLEKENLVERRPEHLEEDQRLKTIILASGGLDYLYAVFLQLERFFKLV
ncbi:MAG: MarR family transcriptional regulator [Candidatus Heimdallarchaeota archaeon]